jgi:hypothetical protein
MLLLFINMRKDNERKYTSLRAEKRRPQNRLSPYSDRIFLLFLERARRRTRKSNEFSLYCADGEDKGAGQRRQLFIAQQRG